LSGFAFERLPLLLLAVAAFEFALPTRTLRQNRANRPTGNRALLKKGPFR